jgi:hypothetical protein
LKSINRKGRKGFTQRSQSTEFAGGLMTREAQMTINDGRRPNDLLKKAESKRSSLFNIGKLGYLLKRK